jgi:hypothetical protein
MYFQPEHVEQFERAWKEALHEWQTVGQYKHECEGEMIYVEYNPSTNPPECMPTNIFSD